MKTGKNKLTLEKNDFSFYRLVIPQSIYTIDLNGDIRNSKTNLVLKSDYTQDNRRNTRIHYTAREIVRIVRKRVKRKRRYKVVSNARLMINTFFSISFNYKIFYKDGNKANTSITNLIIKDTEQRWKSQTYQPVYIDLSDFLPLIERNYRINYDGFIYYEKILLTLQ